MHRWSRLFIPTLREAPADAEVASHKFLLRSGYIRQLGAGIYSYLFLGQRSINKIIDIVRQEMDTIGQEFLLPTIHPAELWEESGRWTGMGQNMFRLQDRKGAWLCLGMTHEEVMTDLARKELRSYKQLPQIWYQIQTKFRDEPRPKAGLLRVRQFIMKDSYSFDIDAAGLDVSYTKHDQVYRNIFTRCGLSFVAVEADSGAMGGSQSQEFMVYTDAGEDLIVSCPNGDYAANLEKAVSPIEPVIGKAPVDLDTEIPTPGITTIEQLSELLGIEPKYLIKTLAYVATYKDGTGKISSIPIVIFIRGDDSLNEVKLTGGRLVGGSFSGAVEFRPMQPEEIRELFGSDPGYLGPAASHRFRANIAGMNKPQFYADRALLGSENMIAGANKTDFHRYIEPNDLPPDTGSFYDDFRLVKVADPCPVCGSPLKIGKAVEVGHIFKLGQRYTEGMGSRVLDPNGKEVIPTMGCYGIGIERILTASIEQNNDANGFWLPPAIAPFDVVVTITNASDQNLLAAGTGVAEALEAAGFDVLLDDRDERAGVKFKDADLVGIPYRINVGKKTAEGKVEMVTRGTASSEDIAIAEVANVMRVKTGR
ncbi:MAG: proline--tRNA ligase [Silvibacterium sp.]